MRWHDQERKGAEDRKEEEEALRGEAVPEGARAKRSGRRVKKGGRASWEGAQNETCNKVSF